MPRGQTSRRIAALLTAAMVAMLLVATGGSARAATGHRTSVSSSHTVTAGPAARTSHAAAGKSTGQHVGLDLTTAPEPYALPVPQETYRAPAAVQARDGRDLTTPTGRGPPAR